MLNLKKILSLIADAGQKLFKKSNIKNNDLNSILKLCDELLSNKGTVFGITVARDITNLYQELSNENKLKQALTTLIPRFEKLCLNTKSKPTYLYYLACAVYIKSGEFRKFFKFFKLFLNNNPRFTKLIKILVNLILAIFKRAIRLKKI